MWPLLRCSIWIMVLVGCTEKQPELKIAIGGDLMLDRGVRTQIEKQGADYLFTDIKKQLQSAAFAIANLECAICSDTLPKEDKKFIFCGNPEWLSSLRKNGITHLNLANNHSLDFGQAGITQTIANLNKYGIKPIGQTCSPTYIQSDKNQLVIFSSCLLGAEKNQLICTENVASLVAQIRKHKIEYPEYSILVLLHWGNEMHLYPTKQQIQHAHMLVDSGADIIIGHHPHVVQTIEKYKGRYICYSIGNFIFDNNDAPANKEIMVELNISQNKITSINLVPLLTIQSRPTLMRNEIADEFKKEIETLSPTVSLKRNNDSWTIQ